MDLAPGSDETDPLVDMIELQATPGGHSQGLPVVAPDGASLAAEAPVRSRGPRELLRGSTREVLARLVDGDPLGVRPRVERVLRRRRLLVDGERAWLRAASDIARRAGRASWHRRPGSWLDRSVERSVDSLLEERLSSPVTERELGLAVALGLAPEGLPAAQARFHALPFECRDAFFELVLEGRSLEALIESGGVLAHSRARQARRALAVLLGPAAAPSAHAFPTQRSSR